MNIINNLKTAVLVAVCSLCCAQASAQPSNKPHLKNNGNATQLVVDGKPMLLLCGELGNSSSSSISYAAESLAKCKQLGLNSAIASISWEQFEPQEGKYDYSLIDGLIKEAEKNNLKLVVIWFASYKNGLSSFAPAWVRRDQQRFPRMIGPSIEGLTGGADQASYYKNILSPFFEASWKADAKAFAQMMKHIKETDTHHTVVMMQVENEAGAYGVDIDRQPVARKLFNSAVPQELLKYLHTHEADLTPAMAKAWKARQTKAGANWKETFGTVAIDAFMAWHFARYLEQVTAAGKKAYDIPMYYNAWLKQPKHEGMPGRYPSGGPIHSMLDIYRAASPSIDLLCPDIYHPEFKRYCLAYAHKGNTLFIPECRPGEDMAAKATWVVGERAGIGFAPFGVERIQEGTSLTECYRVLSQLMPYVTAAQGTKKIRTVFKQVIPKIKGVNVGEWDFDAGELEKEDAGSIKVSMGNWVFDVSYTNQLKGEAAFAMFIQLSDDEFIVTGRNVRMNFECKDNAKTAELIDAEQGEFEGGKWTVRRRLNGDETAHGVAVSFPTSIDVFRPETQQDIVKLKLYSYKRVAQP